MIFVCFTIAVAALMLAPLLPDRELVSNFRGDLLPVYLDMTVSYSFFAIGYYATARNRMNKKRTKPVAEAPLSVRNRYLLLLAAWAAFGTMCSVWQIESTTGIPKYMELVNQGGASAEVARTSSIMLKAAEGGLPGYIKMWNQNSTCAVLILLSLLAQRRRISGPVSYFLVAVVALSFVIRNFVHMDRLALLAVLPAIVQLWLGGSKKTKRLVIALLICVGGLAEIQSLRRGHGFGSIEFFILYLQLGMYNNSLVIETFKGAHTFGATTIFSPLAWLLQGLKHPIPAYFQHSYVWDDAQDLFGYLYYDFGQYSVVLFGLFGAAAKTFDRPNWRNTAKPLSWPSLSQKRLNPFFAYAALSSMFVPAFVGPEFWLTSLNIVFFCWLENRYRHQFFRIRQAKPQRLDAPVGPAAWQPVNPVESVH